jgi:hypothetical protein
MEKMKRNLMPMRGKDVILEPEWSEIEPGEMKRNGGSKMPADPEVAEKKRRRTFSSKEKMSILKKADACKEPGEIGALLRREGIYSSQLSQWRKMRDQAVNDHLAGTSRGPKSKPKEISPKEYQDLLRKNKKLEKQLKMAEAVIAFQKKIAELLNAPINDLENTEDEANKSS